MYKAGEVEHEVGGISWENGKSAATCLGISRLMQGGCVPSKTHSTMSKKIFEEKNLLLPNPKLFSSLQSLSGLTVCMAHCTHTFARDLCKLWFGMFGFIDADCRGQTNMFARDQRLQPQGFAHLHIDTCRYIKFALNVCKMYNR